MRQRGTAKQADAEGTAYFCAKRQPKGEKSNDTGENPLELPCAKMAKTKKKKS